MPRKHDTNALSKGRIVSNPCVSSLRTSQAHWNASDVEETTLLETVWKVAKGKARAGRAAA